MEWSSSTRQCPSSDYFGFRMRSARRRDLLATLVFHDQDFPVTEDLLEIVYACDSWGTCSVVYKAVHPLTAIWALRHEPVRRGAELRGRLDRIHANIRQPGHTFGPKPAVCVPALPREGEDVLLRLWREASLRVLSGARGERDERASRRSGTAACNIVTVCTDTRCLRVYDVGRGHCRQEQRPAPRVRVIQVPCPRLRCGGGVRSLACFTYVWLDNPSGIGENSAGTIRNTVPPTELHSRYTELGPQS